MASTIDQISSLAHASWREAVARTARQRILKAPDTQLRSRLPAQPALAGSMVASTRATGLAAYARQQAQYTRWKDAADASPRRAVTVSTAPRDRGTGQYLDLLL